ncbi:hypothetical protein BIW11_08600 [Tropilaelaps mercedesae]|uniref:Nesprin-1-like n=1 Tax=Tropilaelaps mercedesae TaxID=418985 RepID=A0A1V9XP55_9ACAR|nr:hypothetical protein BIW11_08600 [Tropilaelaps mercedesae]
MPDAARPLERRLDTLRNEVDAARRLIETRTTVAKDVNGFTNWQRDLIEQLKLLEQQLETTKPTPEFLHKVKHTMKTIETTIVEKRELIDGLQRQLDDADYRLVGDDGEPTTLKGEIAKLQQVYDDVHTLFRRRTEQVEKMHAQLEQFNHSATTVNTTIEGIHSQLTNLRPHENTYPAIKELREKLAHLESTIPSREIEQVTDMGRKLIEQDSSSVTTIQNVLTTISRNNEMMVSDISRQIANVEGAKQMWDECRDLHNTVDAVLKSTVSHIEEARRASGHDIPQSVEKLQRAKDALIAQRPTVEQYARKIKTLCEKLDLIPGFDVASVRSDAQERVAQFSVLYEQITQLLGSMENLNVALQQIEIARNSVDKWVTEMSSDLDDALKNISESKARSVLDRYHIEAETQRNFLRSVRDKISSLSGILDTAPLTTQFDEVEQRMNSTQSKASLLESKLKSVQLAEDSIRQKLARLAEWLKEQRDIVSKCDTDDIPTSVRHCSEVKQRLESNVELQTINDDVGQLQKEQPALDLSHLFKDINNIEKRFANVLQQTNNTLQTMQSVLERKYQTALNDVQRWITNTDEKIRWTVNSNPAMDKFNVEAKLATLAEISSGMSTGRDKLCALRLAASQFPDKQDELSSVEEEFTQVEINLADNQAQLEHAFQQWQAIEQMIAHLGQWLSAIEAQAKSETVQAFDFGHLEQQTDTLDGLLKTLNTRQTQFSQLDQMMSRITTEGSDSSLENQVHHIIQRYKAVRVCLENALSQLKSLIGMQQEYKGCCSEVETHIERIERELAAPSGNSKEELETRVERLRALCAAKPELERPVIKMSELGETIQGFLNIESRDQVRTQMRKLKDRWENCWTKTYEQIKNVESNLLSWSGFQDTLSLVDDWLDDLSRQVSGDVELMPTLADKISQLQTYKTLGQDICLHEPVMNKLREYSANMNDQQVRAKVAQAQTQQAQCQQTIERCLQTCTGRVEHHEDLKLKLHDMRSLIGDVEARVGQLRALQITDGDSARRVMQQSKDLQTLKPKGDAQLHTVAETQKIVLEETAPTGHSVIAGEVDALRSAWESLFHECNLVCAESQTVLETIENTETACKKLEDWLLVNLPREHPLKATAQAKHEYVEKLNRLEQEIVSQQTQINNLKSLQAPKIEAIRSVYSSGLTNIRETAQKWAQNANLHSDFDIRSGDFDAWLSSCEVRFTDMTKTRAELSGVKKSLEDLLDHVTQRQAELDKLTDVAERVYPLTSADGREKIRARLRDLSSRYERLSENLGAQVGKLEKSIGQIAELKQSQERLENWLKEALNNLSVNSQLKASLQEKKALLQAHKLVNEDIISQKPVISNMLQKASMLDQDVDYTQFVQSTKTDYDALVGRSAALLERLAVSVEHHSELNDLMREFREWLVTLSHQLEEHKESSGDKEYIQNKLKSLTSLKNKFDHGDSMLSRIQEAAERVYRNTNESGIALIQKEMTELEETLSQHRATRDEAQYNLENVIQQWSSFEKNQRAIDGWLQTMEAELQSIQQAVRNSDLPERRELFATAEALKDTVEKYQRTLDAFTDEGHSLYQVSRVESNQSKVTQTNSTYRTLLLNIKKVISNLSSSLEGLAALDKAFAAFDMWLDDAQTTFDTKIPDSDWQPQRTQLQV